MTDAILELNHLTRRFGGVIALNDVSLSFAPGEIVGLIGPNGAGKTTLVNLVTGFLPKTSGTVRFNGRDITADAPHVIARLGVARTFQIVQPFAEMTVFENVLAGAVFSGRNGDDVSATARARECLDFVGLAPYATRSASELSLANRKRLELAKSLAMRPRLLFLDEVNAGLSTIELDDALALIRQIAATGVTIVIIEHLLKVILSLVNHVVVLHHGAKLSEGSPVDVTQDEKVIRAYIGNKFASRLASSTAPTAAAPLPEGPVGTSMDTK